MKHKTILLSALLCLPGMASCQAQDTVLPVAPEAVSTAAPRMPFVMPDPNDREKFVEPRLSPEPSLDTIAWGRLREGLHASFVSSDIRFARREVPKVAGEISRTSWTAAAWRGERISQQILLWSKSKYANVSLKVSDLKGAGGATIVAKNFRAGFVRYVVADATAGACGTLKGKDLTPFLVSDPIDTIPKLDVEAMSAQPVWLTARIPGETRPGLFQGKITVSANGRFVSELLVQIKVLPQRLPSPEQWSYHLDLMQHPLRVATYYDLKPWSKEHFAKLRPSMEMLKDAGQKSIDTFVFWDPWNANSRGIDNSYIKPTRKKDGSWSFDYSNFDKWVEFMMDIGIKKQITCSGPVPWYPRFYFYDEASGKETFAEAKPGTPQYEEYWKPLLSDFRDHLKAKGWFGITAMVIDERALEDTRNAIALMKKVDPLFKVAFYGKYHPEFQADVHDYSLTLKQIPSDVLKERQEQGKVTTFYTCCWELRPNTFTFSEPADATYMSWFAAANNFDGYIRYAYDMWSKHSLNDTRGGDVPAGDVLLVYPGARSSIRFEKLIEGIQDYEKIRILRAEYAKAGNSAGLAKIDDLLSRFKLFGKVEDSTSAMVSRARATLNALD